jgi:hypothetical protein
METLLHLVTHNSQEGFPVFYQGVPNAENGDRDEVML